MDDLNGYNALAFVRKKMPRIVLVIDDFADLELFCQMDDNFIRLARKGSDVGIHLILATENADVKVVSGVIKHLFPTRICFQTATQIDSRIVLDAPGAEKLSEVGDILMITPENEFPERINTALTANCDMRKVVEFISESVPPVHDIDTGCCKKPKWEHLPNGHTVLTSLRNECFHDDTSWEIVIY